MIVGDFDLIHPLLRPAEAEAVLLVDADAVLPNAIAGKGFQTIARWRFQVVEASGGMENQQFGSGTPSDGRRKLSRRMAVKQLFGFFAEKSLDHTRRCNHKKCVLQGVTFHDAERFCAGRPRCWVCGLVPMDEQDDFSFGRVRLEVGEHFGSAAAVVGFEFLGQLPRDAGARGGIDFGEDLER